MLDDPLQFGGAKFGNELGSRLGRFEQTLPLLCAAQNPPGAFLRLVITASMLCATKGALG